MKKNSETLQKIQEAAMKEFSEKGYMKSSLRKICNDAGVTTGALYFFFKDKDELFCSLVKEPLDVLYKTMTDHYSMEQEMSDNEFAESLFGLSMDNLTASKASSKKNSKKSNKTASKEIIKHFLDNSDEDKMTLISIIHTMYQNRDKVLLLLTKSQGSSLENIADQFIDISTKHYSTLAERMSRLFPDTNISPYIAHWVAHDQVQSIIYAITHIENEADAIDYINNIISYLRGGWISIWLPDLYS